MATLSLVHRYYDPQTAQFLTADPAVSSTGQPYSYADDNPINESDPTGLAPQPRRLSSDEIEALENAAQGKPYDPKVLNRAKKKVVQIEKYAKQRNKQKRESNYAVVTPCPSLVADNPCNPNLDPWAFALPETNPVEGGGIQLWLPGGSVVRNLGLTGAVATATAGIINALLGTSEIAGAAAAAG